MRTDSKVATLSLALLLGACARKDEPTVTLSDDLKRDLATATVAGDLAAAPQKYQRMRFVSDLERPKGSTPAKSPTLAKHTVRSSVRHRLAPTPATEPAAEPAVATATESAAPAEPISAPMPEPMVIAQRPAPDPVNVPMGTSDGGMGERGRNGGIGGSRGVGGLGGILGGIIGAVVIRGGHGGVDKCDPRTDGRNRGPMIDRPDFGMPLPTGQTFPSSRR
ncbi:MAG: hypothetical protein JWL95_1987 [Gemmatimonadetes bacterium]|nr:hypothetical protein [Gemmatimonadota bacterium]